jgi:hypothetical protein
VIDYKDFKQSPGYIPYLANDIAAAKVFLDKKNDAGECNTRNLVLLGAETGATLGALWLRSEWLRHSVQNAGGLQPMLNKEPEGKKEIAAIWLSPSPYLGNSTVDFRGLLNVPTQTGLKQTPMVFAYADGDQSAKNVSKSCEAFLKTDKKAPSYKYTAAVEVKGAKKLRGSDLLKGSLGLGEKLVGYVDDLSESGRTTDWAEQNFGRTSYVWVIPGALRPVPVNVQGGHMPFTDYYRYFAPR